LERYRRFRELAKQLGVTIRDGVETSLEMWLSLCLAEYYEYKKDYVRAIEHYGEYLSKDSYNERIVNKIAYCRALVAGKEPSIKPNVGLPK
jgi:hypothetical protein